MREKRHSRAGGAVDLAAAAAAAVIGVVAHVAGAAARPLGIGHYFARQPSDPVDRVSAAMAGHSHCDTVCAAGVKGNRAASDWEYSGQLLVVVLVAAAAVQAQRQTTGFGLAGLTLVEHTAEPWRQVPLVSLGCKFSATGRACSPARGSLPRADSSRPEAAC